MSARHTSISTRYILVKYDIVRVLVTNNSKYLINTSCSMLTTHRDVTCISSITGVVSWTHGEF
jgi:hypothetical protein